MNLSSSFKLQLLAGLFLGNFLSAQTTASDTRALAPLGLPRLKEQAQAGEAAPVARAKFAESDLTVRGAAWVRSGEKRGARFLTLDATKDWSHPLRGKAGDTVFVSFSVYGSTGTFIEVGGARLIVVDSSIANYATLVLDESTPAKANWRDLNTHAPLEKYDGRLLASFSVLTLRLDPANGVFDLYQGTRLLGDNLPLDPAKDSRQVRVTAGELGAMINGLVQSDENPLYEDANANGIDDRFEQTKKGRLQAVTATAEERKALAKEWRDHQRTVRSPALFVNLPRPDAK